MIAIQLDQVNWEVAAPNADVKVLVMVDPQSGIKVIVPLGNDSAKQIGDQLIGSGKLVVARTAPGLP